MHNAAIPRRDASPRQAYFGALLPLPTVLCAARWGPTTAAKTLVRRHSAQSSHLRQHVSFPVRGPPGSQGTTVLLLFIIGGPQRASAFALLHGKSRPPLLLRNAAASSSHREPSLGTLPQGRWVLPYRHCGGSAFLGSLASQSPLWRATPPMRIICQPLRRASLSTPLRLLRLQVRTVGVFGSLLLSSLLLHENVLVLVIAQVCLCLLQLFL